MFAVGDCMGLRGRVQYPLIVKLSRVGEVAFSKIIFIFLVK